MGLLKGSTSLARFDVLTAPDAIDFAAAAFQEIPPRSELRLSIGFVPLVTGEAYEIGRRRWAFRIRVDVLKADPVQLKERLSELIRDELASGARGVSAKRRRNLRSLAEEELIVGTTPKSKMIEAVIDGTVLYVASGSRVDLGIVMQMLRKVGCAVAPKTPWPGERIERDHSFLAAKNPGESVAGALFISSLVGDREIMIEPEYGYVKIQTGGANASLKGEVLPPLLRELGVGAEILSAKLVWESASFKLDGMSWRLSGIKVEARPADHWTDAILERLERFEEIFAKLDERFQAWVADPPTDRPARPVPVPGKALIADLIEWDRRLDFRGLAREGLVREGLNGGYDDVVAPFIDALRAARDSACLDEKICEYREHGSQKYLIGLAALMEMAESESQQQAPDLGKSGRR